MRTTRLVLCALAWIVALFGPLALFSALGLSVERFDDIQHAGAFMLSAVVFWLAGRFCTVHVRTLVYLNELPFELIDMKLGSTSFADFNKDLWHYFHLKKEFLSKYPKTTQNSKPAIFDFARGTTYPAPKDLQEMESELLSCRRLLLAHIWSDVGMPFDLLKWIWGLCGVGCAFVSLVRLFQ